MTKQFTATYTIVDGEHEYSDTPIRRFGNEQEVIDNLAFHYTNDYQNDNEERTNFINSMTKDGKAEIDGGTRIIKDLRLVPVKESLATVDNADVCELAHELSRKECTEKGDSFEVVDGDGMSYTTKGQEYFTYYYDLITNTLNI